MIWLLNSYLPSELFSLLNGQFSPLFLIFFKSFSPSLDLFIMFIFLPLSLYKSHLHMLEQPFTPNSLCFQKFYLILYTYQLFINYLSKHSYATKANTFPPRAVSMAQSVWLFFTEAFWLFSFLNWLPNVGEQIYPYCATVNRHINLCF